MTKQKNMQNLVIQNLFKNEAEPKTAYCEEAKKEPGASD